MRVLTLRRSGLRPDTPQGLEVVARKCVATFPLEAQI
jgi:hypothetical protein